MAKGKGRELVKLVSTARIPSPTNPNGELTGTFYTTTINKTLMAGKKLEKKKYDKRAINPETGRRGMHVIFKQEKI